MIRRSFIYSLGVLVLSMRHAAKAVAFQEPNSLVFKSVNYRNGLKYFFEKKSLLEKSTGVQTPVTLTILSKFPDHLGPDHHFKDRLAWQDLDKLRIVIQEMSSKGFLLSLNSDSSQNYSSSSFKFKNYAAAGIGYEKIAETINGASVPSNLNFSIQVFEGHDLFKRPKFEFEIS